MSHVTIETARVYRSGHGRRFFTRKGAYYATAKELVKAKYPAYENDEVYDRAPENRWGKRINLFYVSLDVWAPHGYEHGPGDEFCPDRWTNFIRRLARYLQFVDRARKVAHE